MKKRHSGSKPTPAGSNTRVSFRQLLTQYLRTGEEIAEIHVKRSQVSGEPELTNVQVVYVGNDYVELRQTSSSFGEGTFIVRFNEITALER